MIESSVLPNLYMVGAPRCGTTALADFLSTHPDIFVAKKELHYFGSDLSFRHDQRLSRDDYAWFYRSAQDQRFRCDRSTWYLASTRAAEEIAAESPDARIIVMLRRPADMMYSLHSQALVACQEVVKDFPAALSLEAGRAKGQDIPPATSLVEALLYRRAASFADQIERYLRVFGADHVHVIVHEDFARDPRRSYLDALDFLGLDDDGRAEFPVLNSNREMRSERLGRFVRNPPPLIRSVGRVALPSRRLRLALGSTLGTRIARSNQVPVRRPAMDPELHAALSREFADDVARLEVLLGRALPWSPV